MSDFKSKTKTASSELFDPQVEYYTRNFFAGLATFWFGFSSSYFVQKSIRQRLSYPTKLSLGISTIVGASATYFVLKHRTDTDHEDESE